MSDLDCKRVQELLSAAADGETGTAEQADALRHCASCGECARFQRGLSSLAAIPAPSAPQGLVESVLVAVEEERRSAAAADAAAAVVVPLMPETPAPAEERPRRRERAMLITVAALAALFVVGGVGFALVNRLGTTPAGDQALIAEKDGGGGREDSTAAPKGLGEATPPSASLSARFVTQGDHVLGSLGAPQELPPGARSATSIVSSMDATSEPVARRTFVVAGQPDVFWVEGAEGSFEPFQVQTRTLDGRVYVLVSGSAITRMGEWPTLPSRFAEPEREDGWPTFSGTGLTDSTGTEVYAISGSSPDAGFALPPGTTSGPGAGAPVWTWWERR